MGGHHRRQHDKSGKVAPWPDQGDSLVKIINGFEDGAKSSSDLEGRPPGPIPLRISDGAGSRQRHDRIRVDVIKHCANASGNGAMSAAVEADSGARAIL
jgi:basic membrane protein A